MGPNIESGNESIFGGEVDFTFFNFEGREWKGGGEVLDFEVSFDLRVGEFALGGDVADDFAFGEVASHEEWVFGACDEV